MGSSLFKFIFSLKVFPEVPWSLCSPSWDTWKEGCVDRGSKEHLKGADGVLPFMCRYVCV